MVLDVSYSRVSDPRSIVLCWQWVAPRFGRVCIAIFIQCNQCTMFIRKNKIRIIILQPVDGATDGATRQVICPASNTLCLPFDQWAISPAATTFSCWLSWLESGSTGGRPEVVQCHGARQSGCRLRLRRPLSDGHGLCGRPTVVHMRLRGHVASPQLCPWLFRSVDKLYLIIYNFLLYIIDYLFISIFMNFFIYNFLYILCVMYRQNCVTKHFFLTMFRWTIKVFYYYYYYYNPIVLSYLI